MTLIWAIIALLILAGPRVSAQEVETDHDSTFDFSRFRTFAARIGTPWGDPSSETAAKAAFTKRFINKGWKQADESSCDALVVLHGTSPGKQTFRSFYADWPGYGWHNVGAPALADSTAYDYKPGTLVVDIFDTKTRKVVFRGVAQGLTSKSVNDIQKFDRAAKKMVQNLPSGKSSEEKKGAGNQESDARHF